jgi:hypothetical protein
VYAAERHFYVVDDFTVSALVDFAAAMCTNIKVRFDGNGY